MLKSCMLAIIVIIKIIQKYVHLILLLNFKIYMENYDSIDNDQKQILKKRLIIKNVSYEQNLSWMPPIIKAKLFHQEFISTELK